jgi:transposase-like protein
MASKEEKRRIVEGYATSGMTRREYCAKQGIAVAGLLAVETESETGRGGEFTLRLANGRRIESSWRFAEADLLRLIRAAEA